MLEGFQALIQSYGYMVQAFLQAPFYGSMTYGYLLIGIAVFNIFLRYLMFKFN